MKKIALLPLFAFVCLVQNISAQYAFVPDQTGKPLTDARYENITGTPYLIDQWLTGEVKLANGELIKPFAIKYDAVEDKLLFKNDEKIYEFYPQVAGFTLNSANGVRTFLLKDANNKKEGYFELLFDGKIKFLKKTKKIILEAKGYNSANIEKVIDENNKFFIISGGKEIEVKLSKKSFIEALPELKDKITSFEVKTDKKSIEFSFINLVAYLNKD